MGLNSWHGPAPSPYMRHHDEPQHPAYHLSLLTMSALRGITLPDHLREKVGSSPTLYVIGPAHRVTSTCYLEPDFEQLFPATCTWEPPTGADCGPFGCAGDSGSRWWCGTAEYAKYAAMLVYYSAETLFDRLLDALRVGGIGELGPCLSIPDHHRRFNLGDLEDLLPLTLVDALSIHTDDEVVAWVAMLLAEIQMHATTIATGRFMPPHSTGSLLALHLILDDLQLEVVNLKELGPVLPGFDTTESRTPLLMLREKLLSNEDLGDFILQMERTDMYAWFESFTVAQNPWLPRSTAPQPVHPLDDSTEPMSEEEFNARISTAPAHATYLTGPAVRVEFEAWLERYFGVGHIGRIAPALRFDLADNCVGISYENCTATVDGLPLGNSQRLELHRISLSTGVCVTAYLTTSNGEVRVPVRCLAELAGVVR